MCGIAGFLLESTALSKHEAERIINSMCYSIRHRGPDDEGMYLEGFQGSHSNLQVALGHRRLSIIDLTQAAHQPISNEDGSIWLTYNGEIYNFLSLREELIAKGHRFRSHTDSEVIVHAYEEWNEAFVERFNGMFAFALWDNRNKLLLLAVDRMGKKPLYYTEQNGVFVFASEPKALFKFPALSRELDQASLSKYLLYEYVPAPQTIYSQVNKLSAATMLIRRNKSSVIKKYWDLSFRGNYQLHNGQDLRQKLKDSVNRRLVSDVPLGIFLSGGLDSSSITCLAREILGDANIKTFSIGFKERSFDESSYAKKVSDFFHTEHFQRILSPEITTDLISEVTDFLDEPFADASIIPTYLLSRFAREHVTVALSGDGGDELFAGYDTFPAHKLAAMFDKLPIFLRSLFSNAVNLLPVSFSNLSLDFKLKQFAKGLNFKPEIRNQIWLGSFSHAEQARLLASDSNSQDLLMQDIRSSLKHCDASNLVELITYLYCKFYLQGDILTKTDRASMSCGLEVRAPFLDYTFVEYVLSIPSELKLKGYTTKYILKKSMSDSLPHWVVRRQKKGFGIPVARWLAKDLKGLLLDTLAPEKIKREGIFNPQYVSCLLNEHFLGKKDNRKQLWTIFMFELWKNKWLVR